MFITNIVLRILFKKSNIKLFVFICFAVISQSTLAQNQDSLPAVKDSIGVDSLKLIENSDKAIEAPIKYGAKDSMKVSLKTKMIYMYGDAKVGMEEMNLDAGFIRVNMDSNYIYAKPFISETGEEIGVPKFKQGSENYDVDSLKYNLQTKKGVVYGVITEQAGGYLHGTKTKIQPNKEVHILDGKFTTCDAKHPHFYIELTKAKVIPDKRIVTGPFYFVLADVPIPVGLPFGLFPNQKENQSGILMPSYGEEVRRGFYLKNGGYYWAINDYVDAAITGEIYTNGSWGLNLVSKYKRRYKFSGNMNLTYQNLVESEKGLPDYSQSTQFRVVLNYNRDNKANPTSTFRTALNFSSSKFNRYNSYNPNNFANNNTNSSIAYTKNWPGKPFNFSANLNMTQNLSTKNISMQLPTLTFIVNKQFPFKKKIPMGKKKWYEDISVGFDANLKNTLDIGDSLLFTNEALERMNNGLQYNIPVGVSIKLLKYIIFSPSLSYKGRVYSKYTEQNWHEPIIVGEDTIQEAGFYMDTLKGINHLVDFSASAGFSTTLYGMLEFKKGKIAAIRHVIKPTASISFRPDFGKEFWGYYQTDSSYYKYDADSNLVYYKMYSPYSIGMFGVPAAGESGVISLGLSNNLEMKVHSKDTSEQFKKIVLLENLRLGTSYNIAADSLNWAPMSIAATTKLFKKLSVQYTGAVEWYKRDTLGNFIDEAYLKDFKGFGHMTYSSISLSGKITSDLFKKKESQSGKTAGNKSTGRNKKGNGKQVTNNKTGTDNYFNFSAPWNMNIRYTFKYASVYDKDIQDFKPTFTQNVNTNMSLTLNDKWRIGARVDYDIQKRELSYWSMNFYRDLHCWEMSFNFVPFGTYQSYMFRINIKSSIFQGLEWKKQQSWRDNIDFGAL